ncbi:MAG: DUF835 domain-containing protein [Nitrososphaerales archaeon]
MSTALLWSSQYIAAVIIGLALALRILQKEPRVLVNYLLLIYSLLVSIWSCSVFIHRTTPYLDLSMLAFRIGAISLFLAQGTYLSMAFSIRSLKKRYLFMILPALVVSIIYLGFGDFTFTYTSFGWSYRLAGDLFSQSIRGLTNEAYNFAILLTLYSLYKGAASPVLKRKLKFLLLPYLTFQFIGFSATNLVLIVSEDVPPFGGMLHIGTFITMSYALTLSPKPLIAYASASDTSGRYTHFLNQLLDKLPGEALGQKYVLFSQFLKQTNIDKCVSYIGDRPFFKAGIQLDLVLSIEKTLDYLCEIKSISLLDSYLPVINAAYTSLSASERQKLDEVILKHAKFLMECDVFYGVDGGRLLQKVEVDSSLDSIQDTEAALRIYKRILLATFTEFNSVLGSEFLNRLLLYDVLKDIELEADGYISITNCLEKHKNDPPVKIITLFNSFLSQAISQVEDTAPRTASVILGKINRVLELNWRRASKLGIVSALRIALGDLVSESITIPLLNEPITTDTFRASSIILGKSIEEVAGKVILLEFTTPIPLQLAARRLAVEALAKGYDVVVFTRKGSVVEESLTPLDVKYIYLTLIPHTEKEGGKSYVQLRDPTEVLTALSELSPSEASLILFDNLTDLILTTGFDKTYTLLRHVVELAAETKAVILLGLNKDAHEKQQVAALEALVNLTINLEKAAKLLER